LQHNNDTFYSDIAEIAQAFATQTCEIEMLQQRVRRMEGAGVNKTNRKALRLFPCMMRKNNLKEKKENWISDMNNRASYASTCNVNLA